MTDEERAEILEILGHKRHIAAQKCILICLLFYPQGLTIYQIMDILHRGKLDGRRVIQRQMEYLIATGAVVASPYVPKGRGSKGSAIVYSLGVKT